jgi:hypothetical protein
MGIMPSTTEWAAEDISINSAHLEDFFHRDRVRLPIDHSSPLMVPPELLQRLTDWTASPTPRILWIDGPTTDADDLENPVSMVAAKFVNLASQSHVPVLSYFCELRRGESLRPGNSPEVQGVMALASALLRQMIELLLPRFEAEVDFSEARFRLLDGTVRSWDESMMVIQSMVELLPDKVFCIIDGLHWLDDRNTEKYLKDLIHTLRGGKFKTLFTTTGRAPCLREEISVSEALHMEAIGPNSATEGVHGDAIDINV